MNESDRNFLREKAKQIRSLIMDEIGTLGVGHLGGSLSAVEALVVLHYRHMKTDPGNPGLEGRDRFVMSKGHAGPALYAVLADRGYFPKDQVFTLNRPGTILPSHTDMRLTPGVDMTAGSLGQGFSCAVGIAYGSMLSRDGAYTYVMIGDGESQEGQIWEAAMFASQSKLNRLIGLTDYNRYQLDGKVSDVNDIEPLADKWRAFGWNVIEAGGHDVEAVDSAVTLAKKTADRPTMILLHTVKGKGVSFAEQDILGNHSMNVSREQYEQALAELREGAQECTKTRK